MDDTQIINKNFHTNSSQIKHLKVETAQSLEYWTASTNLKT
jgi:hypothetical protein